MGFSELAVTHRLFEPPVVGLAGNLEDPARHRDGAPVVGELSDERVHHFPGRFACDKYAAARRSTSFSCSSSRSEEHTSELQSLMRISYAVFCLKKQKHSKPTSIN